MRISMLILLLISNIIVYSQSGTKKFNPLKARYEFYDSNNRMIGYEKYNSILERHEYYDAQNNLIRYRQFNTLRKEWEYYEVNKRSNTTSGAVTYSKPRSQFDASLAMEALKRKEASLQRAIAESNRILEEKKYREKEQAIALKNQINDIYESSSSYPNSIIDGWHEVYATNNNDFTKKCKVYVKNNVITEFYEDDWEEWLVYSAYPTNKGKAIIEIGVDGWQLTTVYFIKALYQPNKTSTPPIKTGEVMIYTNYPYGLHLFIDNPNDALVYRGELNGYYRGDGPSCGTKSKATYIFTAPPGTYKYLAQDCDPNSNGYGCSNKPVWEGVITVKAEQCSRFRLRYSGR